MSWHCSPVLLHQKDAFNTTSHKQKVPANQNFYDYVIIIPDSLCGLKRLSPGSRKSSAVSRPLPAGHITDLSELEKKLGRKDWSGVTMLQPRELSVDRPSAHRTMILSDSGQESSAPNL